MKNKWDGTELKQRLQSLQELLQSLLSLRDDEPEQDTEPSNEFHFVDPQAWREKNANRYAGWDHWNQNMRPEGIHSQLLTNATDAIRQLNLPQQPTIEEVNTKLLNDISKLDTRITGAVRITKPAHQITDATPALPVIQTGGIPPVTRKLDMDEPPHKRIEYQTKSESLQKMMTGAVLYYACQYSPVAKEEAFLPPNVILMSPNNYFIVLPFIRHRPSYKDGYPLDKEGTINIPYGIDATLNDDTIACVGY